MWMLYWKCTAVKSRTDRGVEVQDTNVQIHSAGAEETTSLQSASGRVAPVWVTLLEHFSASLQ